MRFYVVEIEGRDLKIPDGPIGFFANRYVLAGSSADAEKRARRVMLRQWSKSFDSVPNLKANRIEPIGLLHALRNLRQNRGHTFYLED